MRLVQDIAKRRAWMLVTVPLGPLWTMGWLRDDWLLLWSAVDPETAPAGAQGVFYRPVAEAIWWIAGQAGDQSLSAMHLLTVCAWSLLAAASVRWASRESSVGPTGATFVVLLLASHAALAEPRLWSAASNGVWASALGAWGAWHLAQGRSALRRGLAGVLLLLGVLSRADALLWLLLPLALSWNEIARSTRIRLLTAVVVAGIAALSWMTRSSGGADWQPAVGGELLRRILVPWGPPLPVSVASGLGLAGPLLLLLAGIACAERGRSLRAAAWIAAATVVAAQLTGWSPAGRYGLVAIAATSIALARLGGAVQRRRVRAFITTAGFALLGLHLASALFGGTTGDLLRRSRHEMALSRAVRDLDLSAGVLVLIDPPVAGWQSSAADFENVASATLRRPIRVVIEKADAPGSLTTAPRLRFDGTSFVR